MPPAGALTVAVSSPPITRSSERRRRLRRTRVPVQSLIDYLEDGESLDDFPEAFPGVTREHAIAGHAVARQALDAHATAA